jgi:hypothetical protein
MGTRVTQTPLGATGAGPWIEIDYLEHGFGVGYYVSVQDSSTLTFKIQHAFFANPGKTNVNPDYQSPVSLTRSTTTATLTVPLAFAPKVGDCLIVEGAGAPFDGTFDIAGVTSSTVVTYTVLNSGASAMAVGARVRILHVEDDTVVTGKTASTSGNIAFPINAMRLNLTAYSAGAAILTVNQGLAAGS